MSKPLEALPFQSAWGPALEEALGGARGSFLAMVVIPTIVMLLVAPVVSQITSRKVKVKILLADEITSATKRALEYCLRPRELMLKGYAQFRDEVFGINTRDGVAVVIPPRFLDALKSHPHLSFKASIDNDMLLEFTYFGGPPAHLIQAVKGNMNASLPAYAPILHHMVQQNMPRILGKYAIWTPVKVHDRILMIVGANNARVFQGTDASKDETWLSASTGYVLSVFECIKALKQWPPWLRPFVYRFIPARSAIDKQWTKGRERLLASMEARKEGGGNLEDPPSMLDNLSVGKNEHLAGDVEKQLLYQMTLVAVGTVTTFSSIVQIIYDLAVHPEYISILREEVQCAERDENGYFTKDSLVAMKKMDSFIKESQRLKAADLTTFQRGATADLTLPDGTFIPKGTKLLVNTVSIHLDGEHYVKPLDFDGLRYYKMRQVPGQENKHMYYNVGSNDLAFGFGRHACPGRYLGHMNIKLVLSEILLNYDIALLEGAKLPESEYFEALVSPDPEYEIQLKSRKPEEV